MHAVSWFDEDDDVLSNVIAATCRLVSIATASATVALTTAACSYQTLLHLTVHCGSAGIGSSYMSRILRNMLIAE